MASTNPAIDPPADAVPVVADGSLESNRSVEHRELLSRLGREYAGRVTTDTIVQAVLDAELLMASARIDTFVPILVERHARETLRREAHLIEDITRQVRRARPVASGWRATA